MKKFVFLICTLLLMISISNVAHADSSYSLNTSTKITACVGGTISIPIPITINSQEHSFFSSFDVNISFDSTVLEYNDCYSPNSGTVIGARANDNTVRVIAFGKDYPVGSVAFELKFHAVEPGACEIAVTHAGVSYSTAAKDSDLEEASLPGAIVTVREQSIIEKILFWFQRIKAIRT